MSALTEPVWGVIDGEDKAVAGNVTHEEARAIADQAPGRVVVTTRVAMKTTRTIKADETLPEPNENS